MLDTIIVNFNAGELLTRCVASLLASSIPTRALVVDNASSDHSLSHLLTHLQPDAPLVVLKNPSNLGFAAANNRALGLAQSEYILFLNPDCILPPQTVHGLLQALQQNPQAGMAGCLITNPDGSEQAGCRRRIPTPGRALAAMLGLPRWPVIGKHFQGVAQNREPLPDRIIEVEAISGALMLVRRSALEQVGPLDEGYFMHCEDLDWCLRFRRKGWQILFVPQMQVMHVKGVSSASRPLRVEYYKHRGMLRFYRKFFRQEYPLPLLWLVALGIWLRFGLKMLQMSVSKMLRRT